MTSSPNFHALPNRNKWAVRRHGAHRALKLHPTQDEAWAEAQRRAAATGGKAYLFDKNGRVQQRVSAE